MTKPPESYQSRSFRFACAIVRAYMKLAKLHDVPPHISRQLLRCGTAIGANLEEYKAAQSRRDAAAKTSIALKEARETRYWLRLLLATDLAPASLLNPLLAEAGELVAILTVTRRKLNAPKQG
jgi:four helix bundle protein